MSSLLVGHSSVAWYRDALIGRSTPTKFVHYAQRSLLVSRVGS